MRGRDMGGMPRRGSAAHAAQGQRGDQRHPGRDKRMGEGTDAGKARHIRDTEGVQEVSTRRCYTGVTFPVAVDGCSYKVNIMLRA